MAALQNCFGRELIHCANSIISSTMTLFPIVPQTRLLQLCLSAACWVLLNLGKQYAPSTGINIDNRLIERPASLPIQSTTIDRRIYPKRKNIRSDDTPVCMHGNLSLLKITSHIAVKIPLHHHACSAWETSLPQKSPFQRLEPSKCKQNARALQSFKLSSHRLFEHGMANA